MIESKSYIGKLVEVKIDRPMGSKHPKYGFIYPVNYGYVPNTISGDGDDAIRALTEFQERFFESIIIKWTDSLK